MRYLKKVLSSNRGSALVGVVAFSVILSIAAVTYATLARNSVTNETDAYNDAKAYYAAEAGLLFAANWVGFSTNWTTAKGTTGKSFNNLQIPGFDNSACTVNVNLSWLEEDGGVVLIKSTVKSSLLSYKKTLECRVKERYNKFGAFFNRMDPDVFIPESNIMGLSQRTAFFGPVHVNSPIMVSQNAFSTAAPGLGTPTAPNDINSNRGARFYGPVSVWGGWYADATNSIPSGVLHNFGRSPGGRDFSKGVMVSESNHNYWDFPTGGYSHSNISRELDQVFRGSFNPNADSLKVSFIPPSNVNLHKVTLSTTNGVNSNGSWDTNRDITVHEQTDASVLNAIPAKNTVVIRFGRAADADGGTVRAFYEFSEDNGSFIQNSTRNTAGNDILNSRRVYYDENTPTIIQFGTEAQAVNVVVQGGSELAGQVTVKTVAGADISFRLYRNYNHLAGTNGTSDQNHTVSSNNAVDRFSDGHIIYDGVQRAVQAASNDGFGTTTLSNDDEGFASLLSYGKVVSNSGEAAAQIGGIDLGNMNNKKHLFAFYSDGDIKLHLFGPNDDHSSVKTAIATNRDRIITAQLFAMNPKKKVYIPKGIVGTFVHVVGTTAGDEWGNTDATETKTSPGLRMYHDKRDFGDASPYGPGIGIVNSSGRLTVLGNKWRERNCVTAAAHCPQ